MKTLRKKSGPQMLARRFSGAEERFRLVVEASPSAMIMVNSEGHITLVNVQTEKLFGYPRAELLGQPMEVLVPERYRGAHPGHRSGFFQVESVQFAEATKQLDLCWLLLNDAAPVE